MPSEVGEAGRRADRKGEGEVELEDELEDALDEELDDALDDDRAEDCDRVGAIARTTDLASAREPSPSSVRGRSGAPRKESESRGRRPEAAKLEREEPCMNQNQSWRRRRIVESPPPARPTQG